MVRNGKTSAGKQRWKCQACSITSTKHIDNTAKTLDLFLGWLLSGKTQDQMGTSGRTFRRKTVPLWDIWPIATPTGEVHRVIHVDGIYLARNVVVLIAYSDKTVINWYVARSENSRAWSALMTPIPPPEIVVTDGATGFEKARKKTWPSTRTQRCTFHAFGQVKRQTTTRPKTQAGVDLYGLAKDLLNIQTQDQAHAWIQAFTDWCTTWENFLAEKTVNPDTGNKEWTHKRLVTARNSLTTLLRQGTLFTYTDPTLTTAGPIPRTNNPIEGGVNSQLRELLRRHRGLTLLKRTKAVFWWCYTHSEAPQPPATILQAMPTDNDIATLYNKTAHKPQHTDAPARWGDALVWEELHHQTRWNITWNQN